MKKGDSLRRIFKYVHIKILKEYIILCRQKKILVITNNNNFTLKQEFREIIVYLEQYGSFF